MVVYLHPGLLSQKLLKSLINPDVVYEFVQLHNELTQTLKENSSDPRASVYHFLTMEMDSNTSHIISTDSRNILELYQLQCQEQICLMDNIYRKFNVTHPFA